MNLLVMVLLAQAQVTSPQPEVLPKEPPKWEVYMGFQGGIRPDSVGGGGGALLGVNRQIFFNWLRAELSLGLGVYSQPVDVLTMIRIGARFEWPTLGRLRPFLSVNFAHQHEAGWEHVKMDPIPVVLGLSEHENGIHHRSGIETGLGLVYELPARKGSAISGRIGMKASFTALLGDGPPRYVDVTTLIGLCF
jgi:hypothetical protein